MNRQESTLAGVALEGIDHITCMISVWALYTDRYEEALLMLERRGLVLTEDELCELALLHRRLWGLDDDRAKRPDCYLCRRPLPTQIERLCKCFRAVEAGVHIACTPERIEYLQKKFPRDWEDITMETIVCVRCLTPERIPASKVAASFRKGKTWKEQTQKFCNVCFQKHAQSTSYRPPERSSRPPATKKSQPPSTPKYSDIESLHKLAAQFALPAGDS
jgi:hypothetical protein